MKTYTFKVIDTNEDVHIYSSTQRILDVQDKRHIQSPDCDIIHYSFFERLTRQISPQIESASGAKLWNTFTDITCVDKHFLRQADCFYMLFSLHGKEVSDNLWVKCLFPYDPEKLGRSVDGLMFQLCDEEEHHSCDVQRFGYSHRLVGIPYLQQTFLLLTQTSATDIPESDYPDVMLHIRMKARVNKAKKEQMHKQVIQFIDAWNGNAVEQEKIHYAELYDNGGVDRYTILIHVDFGNCDPVALEQLFQFLINNNSDIKDITI